MQSTAIEPSRTRNETKPRDDKESIASSCALQAAEWLRAYSRILTSLRPVSPAR